MAEWIKMPLGMEVGLSLGDFVFDENQAAPSLQKGGGRRGPSQFSAHFYCGQTATCITMPLGIEVGLSPGDFDGDPAPAPKLSVYVYYSYCTHPVNVLTTKLGIKIVLKRIPTQRSVAFLQLWPNGWMDQDATWYRGRPRPRPHCVRWGPSGDAAPPHFRPMPIVAKRSPISATTELLL